MIEDEHAFDTITVGSGVEVMSEGCRDSRSYEES